MQNIGDVVKVTYKVSIGFQSHEAIAYVKAEHLIFSIGEKLKENNGKYITKVAYYPITKSLKPSANIWMIPSRKYSYNDFTEVYNITKSDDTAYYVENSDIYTEVKKNSGHPPGWLCDYLDGSRITIDKEPDAIGRYNGQDIYLTLSMWEDRDSTIERLGNLMKVRYCACINSECYIGVAYAKQEIELFSRKDYHIMTEEKYKYPELLNSLVEIEDENNIGHYASSFFMYTEVREESSDCFGWICDYPAGGTVNTIIPDATGKYDGKDLFLIKHIWKKDEPVYNPYSDVFDERLLVAPSDDYLLNKPDDIPIAEKHIASNGKQHIKIENNAEFNRENSLKDYGSALPGAHEALVILSKAAREEERKSKLQRRLIAVVLLVIAIMILVVVPALSPLLIK